MGGWRDLLGEGRAAKAAVVGGGMVLHAINVFIVTTILPSVVAEIGGLRLFAWGTTLYVAASLLGGVACARLLHAIGTRWSYRVALAGFALGCALCALAPTMPALLAGRLVQGVGAGILSALSFTQIRLLFPERLWPRAIAIVSAMWGIATLLGPAVGGAFAQAGAWRAAFWSLLALTPLLALLVELVLPRGLLRPPGPLARMNWLNLGLLEAGVIAVSVGGSLGGVTGGAALGLGLACAAGFVAREGAGTVRVLPAGACDPRTPLGRIFAAMVLILLAITTDIFAPYFLQTLHGLQPLPAGYLTAVLSGAWTAGSMSCSGLSARRVPVAVVAGPCLVAAGVAGIALLMPGDDPAGLRLGPLGACLALMGLGIGVCWPHLAAGVFRHAVPGEQALAAASITTVTMVANAYGTALAGAIANAAGLAVPGGEAGAAHAALSVYAAAIAPPLLAALLVRKLYPVTRGALSVTT